MGNPAARSGDFVTHDSPHCHAAIHMTGRTAMPIPHPAQPLAIILGCPTVTIGGQAAARLGDMTATCLPPGCLPGSPGNILLGSFTVTIGGQPAARVGDRVNFPGCAGPIPSPSAKIIGPGCPTVTIG